jgi:serine phosphatase RsbU (regulator of sigma subunit)
MNMFVTMFYGVLDTSSNTLTYINAGHNPPVVLGKDGQIKARLAPTGPAVGIMGDMDFGEVSIGFDPGDLLFAFTDGVPDARNDKGDFFKEERMLPLLTNQTNTAETTLGSVLRAIHEHVGDAARFDDVTMVAVRRTPLD